MKISHTGKLMVLGFTLVAAMIACNNDNSNTLAVSRNEVKFSSEGGSTDIILQTDADQWRIQNPSDWISISPTNGTEASTTITLTVDSKTPDTRSTTLTVIAGTAQPEDILVSQAASEFIYSMSANFASLNFKKGGSTAQIAVTADAPSWEISTDADWLQFDPQSGGEGTTTVDITALENPGSDPKTATISITAEYAPTVEIEASQIGEYYPDYNTSPLPPDESGMSSTATELAVKMALGINIGNTLEATGGETAWGNPKVNKAYVDAVKNLGFTAIRIPCSWDQYANLTTGEIQQDWLDRVKTVVQYCIDNDLYVVLNIHWDGGWLEKNVSTNKQEEVNAKQKAYWQQIATYMRDFDEHLLFASANEPSVEDATQMKVLMSYHQTFIDAVRSTGGKNSYRVLIVQGPSTDIEKTNDLMKSMPEDNVENKLMAELHYYTPYQFCLMTEDADWGKMFYYWGKDNHSTANPDRNATWGEEDDLNNLFDMAKAQFVQKGIPVIIGEFGAYKRNNIPEEALNAASVEYYNGYVVQASLSRGMVPFYWDTGGLINRNTGAVKDQGVLDAMLNEAGN